MGRLDDHRDSHGIEGLLDAVPYLHREPFLDLKPARVCLHDPCYLAESRDCPVRNVCDMRLADEWHEMVLAGRVQLYVFHKDHLAVVLPEERAAENFRSVLPVSLGQELQGFGNPLRGLQQPFPVRVFSQQPEDFTIMRRNLFRRRPECKITKK